MHAHIVHAHPEPGSYNAALTAAALEALQAHGGTTSITDLYQQGFDPVETAAHYGSRSDPDTFAALSEQRHAWQTGTLPQAIDDEIRNLETADLLILQFPLWWHGPPAILKGWMDRVFVNGGLYTSRMRYDTGYFKGRRALVSVTTGAPHEAFGPGSRGGDLDVILWPVQYSLHYMGFTILPPYLSYGVQGHGYRYEEEHIVQDRLRKNLTAWAEHLSNLDQAEPLAFPSWADWDESGRAVRLIS
ncbi:NAD(P)H-dependent oxidoreductase [Gymnodinialimonas sp. 2305UL16-5]|uniref:NAD(P)H-dependent oxidoreductase n=1 Tax=Gymnodinialimonas mytili TaxID=3126503 RepID=UPI00309C46A9